MTTSTTHKSKKAKAQGKSKRTATGRRVGAVVKKTSTRPKGKVIAYRANSPTLFVLQEGVPRWARGQLPTVVRAMRKQAGFRTRLALADRAAEGMTVSQFNTITRSLPVEMAAWSKLLALKPGKKTPGARSTATNLSTLQVEQIYLISAVVDRTVEVLEDHDAALEWLITPRDIFRGKSPMQLLNTSTGADLVLDQLVRMEHGVYS